MNMKHGWFSQKSAELHGFFLYTNEEGEEITVTVITDDPDSSGTSWDDIKYMGPVTKFVRSFRTQGAKYLEEIHAGLWK